MPYVRLVFPVVLLGLLVGCARHDREAAEVSQQRPLQPVPYVQQDAQPATTEVGPEVQRTAVGQQAQEIRGGIDRLHTDLAQRQKTLGGLRAGRSSSATDYFNRIAEINSHLQAGTTAANPNLVAQWRQARADLTAMEGQVSRLSEVSAGLTDDAAVGLYLSNQIHSTLALPGAVDEDHVELNALDGEASILQVQIAQTLGETLNEVNRQNEVLAVEYRNIATTSHAIEVGQILGDSLASVPVRPAPLTIPPASSGMFGQPGTLVDSGGSASPRYRHHRTRRSSYGARSKHRTPLPIASKESSGSLGKPLIVISGDPHDNGFEDKLYTAVSGVLEHTPAARFNVRAVALSQGSAAHWAIQAVELQQKASAVARALTAYGLPRSRISISQGSDPNLQTGEIQVYVR